MSAVSLSTVRECRLKADVKSMQNKTTVVFDTQPTVLGNCTFDGSTKLKKIVIPRSVIRIGSYCFKSSALESVKFEFGSQLKLVETGVFVIIWSRRNPQSSSDRFRERGFFLGKSLFLGCCWQLPESEYERISFHIAFSFPPPLMTRQSLTDATQSLFSEMT